MKAIILAGGLGERLKPLTAITPKPLLPINGKPILLHVIEGLKRYGITDVILAIGYKAEQIHEFLGDGSEIGVNISYFIEKERLGTGGAIRFASSGIDDTFIVLNGDNLADYDYSRIIESHKKNKAKLTLTLTPVADVSQFGVAELDGEKIKRFVEKPKKKDAPSDLINAGAYVFEPCILEMLPAGKCSIEYDCFEKLCPEGCVYSFIHRGQWYPTDNMERYEKAKNFR